MQWYSARQNIHQNSDYLNLLEGNQFGSLDRWQTLKPYTCICCIIISHYALPSIKTDSCKTVCLQHEQNLDFLKCFMGRGKGAEGWAWVDYLYSLLNHKRWIQIHWILTNPKLWLKLPVTFLSHKSIFSSPFIFGLN